jgi:nicotinate-nucleotide adenylyltransferase
LTCRMGQSVVRLPNESHKIIPMRIGILGGTFDPVHYGHLLLAEQAREQGELDQVWFLPSARPPHKLDQSITPFERRAEMLTLAIAGQEAHFRVETLEKDRPGPSYTADTLDELAAAHPKSDFFLIVGADVLPDLQKWYEPQRILARASLLVSARPGFDLWSRERVAESLGLKREQVRMQVLDIPLIEISSRDLRRRVSEQRSLLYQLPRAVEVYIRERKLYRDVASPNIA